MKTNVVLYMTHYFSQDIVAGYLKLREQVPENCEVVVLYDNTRSSFDRKLLPNDAQVYLFSESHIQNFKYPVKNYIHPGKIFPMDVDYVFLDFFHHSPHYDYYWVVEYDVQFTGDWRVIFEHFAPSTRDLLATNIHRYAVFPGWPVWKTLRMSDDQRVSQADWVRAFFPFCRFSRLALETIDSAYQQGWAGHYEVSIGTLLLRAGLSIEDFGGQGEFVKSGNENRFYTSTVTNKFLSPGTFIYRPLKYKVGNLENKLWHPVKEFDPIGAIKKRCSVLFWKQWYWDWLASRRRAKEESIE